MDRAHEPTSRHMPSICLPMQYARHATTFMAVFRMWRWITSADFSLPCPSLHPPGCWSPLPPADWHSPQPGTSAPRSQCTMIPLHHFPLHHVPIAPFSHCTIFPLHHVPIAPFSHCTIFPLHHVPIARHNMPGIWHARHMPGNVKRWGQYARHMPTSTHHHHHPLWATPPSTAGI